jgi:L-fuculose-phosphate aldolase
MARVELAPEVVEHFDCVSDSDSVYGGRNVGKKRRDHAVDTDTDAQPTRQAPPHRYSFCACGEEPTQIRLRKAHQELKDGNMQAELSIDAAKACIVAAGRILEHQGQGDMTRGHVSLRVPGNPQHFFMKPHSIGFDEITPENILTIDLDGNVVAGTARRHSEVFIHSEVFRVRPDVQSVIHVHPIHAVALSATGRSIRPLNQGGAIFAGALPLYTDTIDLIRTPAMGAGVAKAMGPHRAVLLKSHGVVMTGASVEEAVVLCVMLEEAARTQLLAEATGPLLAEFPPDDVARLRHNLTRPDQFAVNFAYLARKAGVAGW